MNDLEPTHEQNKHLKRIDELSRDRGRILTLPASQALNEILDHPQCNALVHSFAEEDFFFLVHDVGPEDSLELLSLASDRQWEFILDMESWAKDRINLNAVTFWLNLLLKADASRFTQWITNEHPEFVEYYMSKTCDIRIREHDQDPSEMGGHCITFNDVFYIKIPDPSESSDAEDSIAQKQKVLLTQLLSRMADADHVLYQHMLLRATNVIPAESEEEFYRFRNVRLAEKGFQPFDEAVGIYQHVNADDLKKRKKILAKERDLEAFVPVPLHHQALMEKNTVFSQALSLISAEEVFQQIQVEFAGLCNRIISADQQTVHEREDLRAVVKKACGYLSIGLERLSQKNKNRAGNRIPALITDYPLADIFRAGYSMISALRRKARIWMKNSWFSSKGLALSFWGEELVGVLGGLLIKRPKFFDNYKTGVLYREFETMADVDRATAALNEAIAFDRLLSCFSIDIKTFPKDFFITHKNLILTLWARHQLRLDRDLHRIPMDVFKTFYMNLWANTGEKASVKESLKTEFLHWLAATSGIEEEEISTTMGNALERMFAEIAAEYGNVKFKDLDPRFVHLFMLA